MVMVPDMANFAPHIHAVFGRFSAHELRHMPYTVADTTPRTEPLVQALDTLLQLPQLRITRVEWHSLFEVAAVRERFGLEEHDVAQLDTWLADAGVRWGLDAPHRKPWGIAPDLADAQQNSWLFGLERLLLGYAVGAASQADAHHTLHATPWQDTLPHAGVGGLDAHVIEGLLQWLRHTHLALIKLRQDHTPTEWVAVLQQLVALFFKPSDEADERLIERIMAPLETWLAECQLARLDSPLPLVVVREHWMAQLQQPAMQRRFFGGGVQFATLMPMRSIPFKVVCLLGMNDGDYPRSQTPRDFDLMSDAAHAGSTASHWRAGDRSRREDDRYLFLEALLSAREKLYISWQGRRTADHEIKPPSVLVAQLMDYLNAVWVRADAAPHTPAYDAPLQPLHAFSPAYFRQDSGLYTYAVDWQAAQSQAPLAPTHTTPTLTGEAPTELTHKHLNRLLKQPVDVFVRDRLRVHLDTPEEASAQEEPFALNHLDSYALTHSIVQAPDPEHALHVLRLSGALALAGFGQAQQDMLLQQRDELLERFDNIAKDWPLDVPVQSARFTLGQHTLSAEWANGQHLWKTKPDQRAWLQVDMRPGSVLEGKDKAKQPRVQTLTTLWLYHLMACASGTPTTSVQIGLNGAVQLDPLSASEALGELQNLATLYQEAWQHPLPVARKTACAFAMAYHTHPNEGEEQAKLKAALQAAQHVFEGNRNLTGEYDSSATLQRVFHGFADVQEALPHMADRLYGAMVKHARLLSAAQAHEEADA
jgi:exodeoxyribonuclease V gamma subunit